MEREREKEQSGEQGGGKRYYLWGGWMGECRRAMHRQHLVHEWLVLCPQMYGNAGRELFLNIRRYR